MTLEHTNTEGSTPSASAQGNSGEPTNGVQIPIVQDVTEAIKPLLKQPEQSGYPASSISLVQRHIDEPRELRVAVVGAGMSGILAGILLPIKVPNIKLTIFEKNADVVSMDGMIDRY